MMSSIINNSFCETCTHSCKQFSFATVVHCPKYQPNGKNYTKQIKKEHPIKSITREYTTKEIRSIRNLVHTHCANYSNYYNECLLLDSSCYMLEKRYVGNLCKYFKEAVLPNNPALEISITGQYDKNLKPCQICGILFPVSGRKVYCSDLCREKGTRIKEREKKRKQRLNGG